MSRSGLERESHADTSYRTPRRRIGAGLPPSRPPRNKMDRHGAPPASLSDPCSRGTQSERVRTRSWSERPAVPSASRQTVLIAGLPPARWGGTREHTPQAPSSGVIPALVRLSSRLRGDLAAARRRYRIATRHCRHRRAPTGLQTGIRSAEGSGPQPEGEGTKAATIASSASQRPGSTVGRIV